MRREGVPQSVDVGVLRNTRRFQEFLEVVLQGPGVARCQGSLGRIFRRHFLQPGEQLFRDGDFPFAARRLRGQQPQGGPGFSLRPARRPTVFDRKPFQRRVYPDGVPHEVEVRKPQRARFAEPHPGESNQQKDMRRVLPFRVFVPFQRPNQRGELPGQKRVGFSLPDFPALRELQRTEQLRRKRERQYPRKGGKRETPRGNREPRKFPLREIPHIPRPDSFRLHAPERRQQTLPQKRPVFRQRAFLPIRRRLPELAFRRFLEPHRASFVALRRKVSGFKDFFKAG